jgi:hypothetical protein
MTERLSQGWQGVIAAVALGVIAFMIGAGVPEFGAIVGLIAAATFVWSIVRLANDKAAGRHVKPPGPPSDPSANSN